MTVAASTLDLPFIEGRRTNEASDLPRDQWLARNPFGYAVWHYDDALGILRDAAKRWPTEPEPQNALGTQLVRRGALDEAIDTLRKLHALGRMVARSPTLRR